MIVCLHSYKGRAKTCHTAKNMTKTDTKQGVDVSRMGCFIHYIYKESRESASCEGDSLPLQL